MSSPSLKDLPKVALDLKSELEGFNHGGMKKAATAEKNVLPSAEGRQRKCSYFSIKIFCVKLLLQCDPYNLILYNIIDTQSSNVNQLFLEMIDYNACNIVI